MDSQRSGCFLGHKTAIWFEMNPHTFDFDKELQQATTVFCSYVNLKIAWLVSVFTVFSVHLFFQGRTS